LIKFEDFSFGFPGKELYNDINIELHTGEHAVLIGSNGSGKSTLVHLILQEDKYTYDGLIRMDRKMRIGYISQFVEQETADGTVFEFLAAPFLKLLEQNDTLCAQMGTTEDLDVLYTKYQKVLDEIDAVDAYNYESNIGKALSAAGLTELKDRLVNQLSGGEYKLLFILRNMLLKPMLLIMDEPDVFLDFENLVALIKLINQYEGTLLTITHNRLLLTQCFDKIWNIENKSIREFPGTFPEYVRWMLETKIEIFEHVRDFDEFLERQEELVKKIQLAAEVTAESKYGKQLKARATYIARLKKMRGDDPFLEEHDYAFQLAYPVVEAEENGSVAPLEIAVSDYTLSYDGQEPLLQDVSFHVAPGEKVALVGTNGTGKSSMLRDIYQQMEEKEPGAAGYFKQIVESDQTLQLSGGERNMEQIETLCQNPHRGLLLDEPTSHLDIYAQIALEKAVREYPGTVLMVSHDLFAVTGCADRILMVEHGELREMSGRAYRKSIYKKYFSSDIFEAEKTRIELEMKVTELLRTGKYDEARKVLGFPKEEV